MWDGQDVNQTAKQLPELTDKEFWDSECLGIRESNSFGKNSSSQNFFKAGKPGFPITFPKVEKISQPRYNEHEQFDSGPENGDQRLYLPGWQIILNAALQGSYGKQIDVTLTDSDASSLRDEEIINVSTCGRSEYEKAKEASIMKYTLSD
ncbi:hypothetical protein C8R42DRAFT_647722 [Lentinula raphanica]|nr:hypothetical protein C8R42DRAFT_647722 [Lentinula raphanica]